MADTIVYVPDTVIPEGDRIVLQGKKPDPAPPQPSGIIAVSPNSAQIAVGKTTTSTKVTWDTKDAVDVTVINATTIALVAKGINGTVEVDGLPAGDTKFHLYANGLKTFIAEATVRCLLQSPPPTPPVIKSFTATPASVNQGSSSILEASVDSPTSPASLAVDQGVGNLSGSKVTVTPQATTTYTLSATNAVGTSKASATVAVVAPPSPIPDHKLALLRDITPDNVNFKYATSQYGIDGCMVRFHLFSKKDYIRQVVDRLWAAGLHSQVDITVGDLKGQNYLDYMMDPATGLPKAGWGKVCLDDFMATVNAIGIDHPGVQKCGFIVPSWLDSEAPRGYNGFDGEVWYEELVAMLVEILKVVKKVPITVSTSPFNNYYRWKITTFPYWFASLNNQIPQNLWFGLNNIQPKSWFTDTELKVATENTATSVGNLTLLDPAYRTYKGDRLKLSLEPRFITWGSQAEADEIINNLLLSDTAFRIQYQYVEGKVWPRKTTA